MLVLDNSVIIKWFTREKGRDRVIEYRNQFLKGEIDIALSDLILYEITNVLRYNPNFDKNDVMDAMRSIIGLGVQILVPTTRILNIAIDFSFTHDITIYDAVYVALAKELNYDFVTADRKLFEKIEDLAFVKLIE